LDGTLPFLTGGRDKIDVQGDNVNQCLDNLRTRFPSLKRMFDNQDNLWSDISIYLNRNSIDSNQPVSDGDELTLVPGIAGG
jgi:molybdopterin converting factor small subunit